MTGPQINTLDAIGLCENLIKEAQKSKNAQEVGVPVMFRHLCYIDKERKRLERLFTKKLNGFSNPADDAINEHKIRDIKEAILHQFSLAGLDKKKVIFKEDVRGHILWYERDCIVI